MASSYQFKVYEPDDKDGQTYYRNSDKVKPWPLQSKGTVPPGEVEQPGRSHLPEAVEQPEAAHLPGGGGTVGGSSSGGSSGGGNT